MSSFFVDSEKFGGLERRTKRWKSSIRVKDFDRVLRLVSTVTDAVWRRERVKGEVGAGLGLRSGLYDVYSRRAFFSVERVRGFR